MPSKRHHDKRQLSIWVTEEIHAKFKKRAQLLGMSMSELILAFVLPHTEKIELTPEEYEEVLEKIRKRTKGVTQKP